MAGRCARILPARPPRRSGIIGGVSIPLPELDPEPPRLDPAAVTKQLDAGLKRLSSLVRGIPDLSAPAVGTWSAADVAAHVATEVEIYAAIARGEGSPYTGADPTSVVSQRYLESVGDRTPYGLADRIDAGRPALLAAVTGGAHGADIEDPLVPWHRGITLHRSVVTALLVAEVCVHGHDIAQASRRMWHLEPAEAATAFRSYLRLADRLLTPAAAGHTARYVLRVRGFPVARAVLSFTDGRLAVEGNPQGRVDCHVSATAPALLMVLMGRSAPRRATLRGDVWVHGRRPWLAHGLPKLFRAP